MGEEMLSCVQSDPACAAQCEPARPPSPGLPPCAGHRGGYPLWLDAGQHDTTARDVPGGEGPEGMEARAGLPIGGVGMVYMALKSS